MSKMNYRLCSRRQLVAARGLKKKRAKETVSLAVFRCIGKPRMGLVKAAENVESEDIEKRNRREIMEASGTKN